MSDNPNYPIGTAVVSWMADGQVNIRVYSTDGYNVIERVATSSGWENGSFSQPGSQVSATCWQDSGGVHIRVYCTFQDKTVEWCSDPGQDWTQGQYTTS